MCAKVQLDTDQFFHSLKKLYGYWRHNNEEKNIKNAKILTIIFGNNKNDIYAKSSSLYKWMFGYELTDTVIIFAKNTCHIITSKKKIDFLSDLNENKENHGKDGDLPKLNFLVKNKNDNTDLYNKIKEFYNRGKVGVVQKDLKSISVSTEFTTDIVKLLPESSEQIDISNELATVMAVKSASEINILKKSATVSTNIYNKVYKDLIMKTIDKDKKIKHSKLTSV